MNADCLNPTYTVTVAPTAAIQTVAELRLQCRIDHAAEDSLLESLCEAATQMVESDTNRFLRPATVRLQLDAFPGDKPIEIERTPVTAVTSVTYTDTAGATQTWSSSEYRTDLARTPGRITPAYGYFWPSARAETGAVQVLFTTGYAAGTVPELAIHAVRLLVGTWYETSNTFCDEKQCVLVVEEIGPDVGNKWVRSPSSTCEPDCGSCYPDGCDGVTDGTCGDANDFDEGDECTKACSEEPQAEKETVTITFSVYGEGSCSCGTTERLLCLNVETGHYTGSINLCGSVFVFDYYESGGSWFLDGGPIETSAIDPEGPFTVAGGGDLPGCDNLQAVIS